MFETTTQIAAVASSQCFCNSLCTAIELPVYQLWQGRWHGDTSSRLRHFIKRHFDWGQNMPKPIIPSNVSVIWLNPIVIKCHLDPHVGPQLAAGKKTYIWMAQALHDSVPSAPSAPFSWFRQVTTWVSRPEESKRKSQICWPQGAAKRGDLTAVIPVENMTTTEVTVAEWFKICMYVYQ